MLGSDAAFVLDGQYYAFRPDSWDWDWLPAPPPSDGVACSVDRDVVVADVESSTVSVLEPGATAWDVERTRDRAIESATAATVCTDASLVAFAPDLRSVAAFDVAARRWSAIAPPPFPATGPLVGLFTGKIALFYRPVETVDLRSAERRVAYGATRHHRATGPGGVDRRGLRTVRGRRPHARRLQRGV